MIYKYTKCESVIAKIMADADMSDKSLRVSDIREWIFEAVEKIGAPMQYMQKESGRDGCPILKICDKQVPMPDDLESLTAVAYSSEHDGKWIPARKDDRTFHNNKPGVHSKYHHHPEQAPREPWQTTLSQAISNTGTLEFSDKDKPWVENNKDVKYFVKPGWIVLNRDHGYVKLAYKSIATDERGYPLIPDLASYQEAIYWYVMMKLNFPKFIKGTLGGKAKFNFNTYAYLQQQWNFYRNQAYAEAMMPNESEMMSIKHEWNKLVPNVEADYHFFNDLGEREIIYNDSYGY